ncbi:MAG: acylphosphatase [Planctomycetota bacterium]
MDQAIVRESAVFRGRVQGVGFRATCRAIAGDLGLTGWVRNEAYGTVACEVQGLSDAVESFYSGVADTTWGRVDAVTRHDTGTVEGEAGFVIR